MLKYKDFVKLVLEDLVPVDVDKEEVGKVDRKDVDRVVDILKKFSPEAEPIRGKLLSFGFSEKNTKSVMSALEGTDYTKLDKYLNDPTIQIPIDTLSGGINYESVFNKDLTGLSPKVLDSLINASLSGSAASGKGEAALIVLLKDGSVPGRGDILVANKEVEVKGETAKFIGQKGFAQAIGAFQQTLEMGIQDLFRNQIDSSAFHRILSKIKIDGKAFGSDGFFSVLKKKSIQSSGFFEVLKEARKRLKNDGDWMRFKADCVSQYILALRNLYPSSIDSHWNWIMNEIDDKTGGVKDVNSFLANMASTNYLLYSKEEGHQGIVFLNTKTKRMIYYPPSKSNKLLADIGNPSIFKVEGITYTKAAAGSMFPKVTYIG